MTSISVVLMVNVALVLAVNVLGDDDCSCCYNDCNCGSWLGLHCGTRVNDKTNKGEEILTGNCAAKGFYQCSAINQPATFKGYCPNCEHSNIVGKDTCLSPTYGDMYKSPLFN